MILKLPVRFEGTKGEKILYTLFDSGATFSCIHPDFAEEIAEPQKMLTPLEVATGSQGINFNIKEKIVSDFYINGIRMSDEFAIVPNLMGDAIIGITTLRKWRINLDYENNVVTIDSKDRKAILIDLKLVAN
jgi:hypothetical protein